MVRRSIILGVVVTSVLLHAAVARADVCVSIDTARDTLSPPDRAAALILIGRQLEAEGQHVASDRCDEMFLLSHVRFGDTITVTLAGPRGQRQGVAIGMNDVPALYSQLVRALLTGEAVGSMGKVVDRTNVIERQADPLRVEADSMSYARLGYGAVFGSDRHGAASMGFGIRRELDTFAVDASFFNVQAMAPSGGYYATAYASSTSLVKLELLRYQNGRANATPYYGGGLSWGTVSSSNGSRSFSGGGLQGELTAGYELMRASNLRVFVQTDVVLPFYTIAPTYQTFARASVIERRYMPSASVSLGIGWSRGGRRP